MCFAVSWSRLLCPLLAIVSALPAATLEWGASGDGGSGSWDSTSSNWWNGTQNVQWSDSSAGTDVVFGGTAGTVTNTRSLSQNPVARSLTFNTPGYTVTDGWIEGGSSGLIITTNASATINSLLTNGDTQGTTLTKNGAATLTLTGTNFFSKLSVTQGELLSSGSNSVFFSETSVSAGATLTLGQTSSFAAVHSLKGSGVVRPNDQSRTVTLTVWGGDASSGFTGTLADNGAGKLALTLFTNGTTKAFTGANTYSGDTRVVQGTLSLSREGTALATSSVRIEGGGTLIVDNIGEASQNRLADTAGVTLRNGTLRLNGNASAAVTEQLGVLSVGASARVDIQRSGAPDATLHFAGLDRIDHGVLQITGNGTVQIDGLSNDDGGIIGGHVLVDDHWGVVSGNGSIQAFDSYQTSAALAGSSDNVLLATGTTLAGPHDWHSLKIQNSDTPLLLDVGTSLILESGALLVTGPGDTTIQGGPLSSGTSPELLVTNRQNLHVHSSISDGVGSTSLVKAGAGTLTLTGDNTYTGNTRVHAGILEVASDSNLGAGTAVYLNDATLRASGSFSTTKTVGANTGHTALIDTNGHHLTFQTAASGPLSKRGAGTLTLAGGATGPLSVNQGTLALAHGAYSSVFVQKGGTLSASGSISSLHLGITTGARSSSGGSSTGYGLFVSGDNILDIGINTSNQAPVIDIGGDAAADLDIASLDTRSVNEIVFRYGLGASQQDRLTFGSLSSSGGLPLTVRFDFHDLGGLETGLVYSLLEFSSPISRFSSPQWTLSDDLIAAGWQATFNLVGSNPAFSTSLTVLFSAIPEPASAAGLSGLCMLGICIFVRRPRRRPFTRGSTCAADLPART
jgi:autotransporter-associated beta strand protein